MLITIIGICAGILVATSMIPEIIRCYKTKSTRDLSIVWLLMNMSGQILWIVYGLYINAWVLIGMSIAMIILIGILLYLKLFKFKS